MPNKLVLKNQVAKKITKDMIGLFFEDINFAADGGLYAGLLENRSFEAIKSKGSPRNYVLKEDNLYAWHSINQKEENLEISCNQPVNEKNPHYLSGGEKQLVALASALVTDPKILILDESLSMLNGVEKNNILKLLKKLVKDKKMTIINVTHDMEETVYGDKIVVLDFGKILFNDNKEVIYKEEKKLKSVGLELPFMVDLSNKLRYYGLVDEDILSMSEMVNHLWK